MKKPTMKSEWRGLKGNKFRVYKVVVEGKTYYHQSKIEALRQFNAAKKVYLIHKINKTKKSKYVYDEYGNRELTITERQKILNKKRR